VKRPKWLILQGIGVIVITQGLASVCSSKTVSRRSQAFDTAAEKGVEGLKMPLSFLDISIFYNL
jgi:hypothetical protein